ncbi:hypothetical protein ACT7C3_17555 [Bacillus pacificus]
MNSYKMIIYIGRYLHMKIGNFILLQLKNGLCFIGSQDETFEELNIWARKSFPTYIDP